MATDFSPFGYNSPPPTYYPVTYSSTNPSHLSLHYTTDWGSTIGTQFIPMTTNQATPIYPQPQPIPPHPPPNLYLIYSQPDHANPCISPLEPYYHKQPPAPYHCHSQHPAASQNPQLFATHHSINSKPAVVLRQFSGDDPHYWLFNTEAYFLSNPCPLETRFKLVTQHLRGNALTWFNLWADQLASWEKFRDVFNLQFCGLSSEQAMTIVDFDFPETATPTTVSDASIDPKAVETITAAATLEVLSLSCGIRLDTPRYLFDEMPERLFAQNHVFPKCFVAPKLFEKKTEPNCSKPFHTSIQDVALMMLRFCENTTRLHDLHGFSPVIFDPGIFTLAISHVAESSSMNISTKELELNLVPGGLASCSLLGFLIPLFSPGSLAINSQFTCDGFSTYGVLGDSLSFLGQIQLAYVFTHATCNSQLNLDCSVKQSLFGYLPAGSLFGHHTPSTNKNERDLYASPVVVRFSPPFIYRPFDPGITHYSLFDTTADQVRLVPLVVSPLSPLGNPLLTWILHIVWILHLLSGSLLSWILLIAWFSHLLNLEDKVVVKGSVMIQGRSEKYQEPVK